MKASLPRVRAPQIASWIGLGAATVFIAIVTLIGGSAWMPWL